MKELSRRSFLKGAAGIVGMAAVGALTGCAANTASSTSTVAPVVVTDPESVEWAYESDVVVMGGGNGGLSAAAAAAEEGKKVILLEISAYIGGGSVYSGGGLHDWGCGTWDEFKERTDNLGDAALHQTYVETFRNVYIPWLEGNNVPITKLDGSRGYTKDWSLGTDGDGYIRLQNYFDALAKITTDNGGTILTQTKGVRLVVDESNTVCGVLAQNTVTAEVMLIKAGDVILATGGFQANKGLVSQFMGQDAETTRVMGTPYNTGSGMLMAQGVGAKLSGNFANFSGTMCAYTPNLPSQTASEFETARAGDPQTLSGIMEQMAFAPNWVTYLFSEDNPGGILVNLNGKRFIDEVGEIESKYCRIPQQIVKQKKAMAFIVADQTVYDADATSAAMIGYCESFGVECITGDTIEEFTRSLNKKFGMHTGALINTINDYNKAVDAGTADLLDIPRSASQISLNKGPYYAIPVSASIYHTFGGLAINTNAQVLGLDGSPIQHLYACPPTAGIFREVYGGGIASAGTFGYIAGKHCAQN